MNESDDETPAAGLDGAPPGPGAATSGGGVDGGDAPRPVSIERRREATARLRAAREALREGRHAEASAICDEVLLIDPEQIDADRVAAECAFHLGDLDGARARIDRRVVLPDMTPRWAWVLHRVATAQGDWATAEAALDVDLASTRFRKARADFAQTRFTGAAVRTPSRDGAPRDDRRIATWHLPTPDDGRRSVVFAGDTSLRSNWGCRATSSALRRLVAEAGGRIDHTMDMAQWPAYFGDRADAALAPETPDDLARIAGAVRSDDAVARALRGCDLVVLNGEGAFLDFNPAGRRLFALAHVARTVFGKPCILVNQTADFADDRLRGLAEAVYPQLDDVTFRERVSLARAGTIRAALGLPQTFAADAIHTLAPLSPAAWAEACRRDDRFAPHFGQYPVLDPSRPYVVLGGSARFRFQAHADHDLVGPHVALARGLARRAQVVVVSIEHQEDAWLREVAYRADVPFFGAALPVAQGLDLLAHSSLYVGGRWHTALKALIGGAPVVCFATNSPVKTRGLLDLYGLEQEDVDLYDLDRHRETVLAQADRLLGAGEALRRRLRDRAGDMARSARDNLRFLTAPAS